MENEVGIQFKGEDLVLMKLINISFECQGFSREAQLRKLTSHFKGLERI